MNVALSLCGYLSRMNSVSGSFFICGDKPPSPPLHENRGDFGKLRGMQFLLSANLPSCTSAHSTKFVPPSIPIPLSSWPTLVSTRLDYCNSLYYGLRDCSTHRVTDYNEFRTPLPVSSSLPSSVIITSHLPFTNFTDLQSKNVSPSKYHLQSSPLATAKLPLSPSHSSQSSKNSSISPTAPIRLSSH
jgi:hypothetical protein